MFSSSLLKQENKTASILLRTLSRSLRNACTGVNEELCHRGSLADISKKQLTECHSSATAVPQQCHSSATTVPQHTTFQLSSFEVMRANPCRHSCNRCLLRLLLLNAKPKHSCSSHKHKSQHLISQPSQVLGAERSHLCVPQ